jgi:hypothetical protein
MHGNLINQILALEERTQVDKLYISINLSFLPRVAFKGLQSTHLPSTKSNDTNHDQYRKQLDSVIRTFYPISFFIPTTRK